MVDSTRGGIKLLITLTTCGLVFAFAYEPFSTLILYPFLSQLEMMKEKQRPFINKGEDILPFEKMKEQRMRERMARVERVRRAVELRR